MTDVDYDALHGFLDESNESLQGIENDFIALENDPGNMEIINRIFRPVHSLKGNSGFFGLTNINKFAHRLENLLDCTRKGEIIVSKEVIDVLLRGVEYLQEMLDRVHLDPDDIAIRADEEAFLARVEGFQPQAAEGSIQSIIRFETLLEEFLDCGLHIKDHKIVGNLLDQIAKTNIALEKLIASRKVTAVRPVYAADCCYFWQEHDCSEQVRLFGRVGQRLSEKKTVEAELLAPFVQAFAEVAEMLQASAAATAPLEELGDMLSFLDDEMVVSHPDSNQSLQKAINGIVGCFTARPKEGEGTSRLGEILVEGKLVGKEQLEAALGKQKKIGELLVAEGALSETDLERALEIQGKRTMDAHLQTKKSSDSAKTIRIDQGKLDGFAEAVGGLYINLDALNYLKKVLEKTDINFEVLGRFDNAVHGLDAQLEHLHSAIMAIRRVPVRPLLQRFPKVVRQLAASLDKDVRFTMAGEDTVIDKDLLEKIENPLVHILRNSLDHGLEMPADREAHNKPAQGNLHLAVSADENNAYLTITDDGGGIDPEKMKRIAVKKGFMAQEEVNRLSEDELVNLIFRPGLSTAAKVTDVSGRGVGMDVVLSALKECNGTIKVASELGQGTTVAITIPLTKTLVTKEAVIVRCNAETYIIPSEHISTIVEQGNTVPVLGRGQCIPYGDELYHLIDLGQFYYPGQARQTSKESIRNVVICEEFKVGLVVDEILNHQRIVAKDFKGGYDKLKTIEGVEGYTIMGNEEINLIVDVKAVSALAECGGP